jgi:antitoxin component of MazEF toxin-antitoxin module
MRGAGPQGVGTAASRDYSNYMKVRLVRIGNSRGVRIPQELIRTYGMREGALLEIEERREGILLRVGGDPAGKIPWDIAYREMAAEAAEQEEWSEWDTTAGDSREA